MIYLFILLHYLPNTVSPLFNFSTTLFTLSLPKSHSSCFEMESYPVFQNNQELTTKFGGPPASASLLQGYRHVTSHLSLLLRLNC